MLGSQPARSHSFGASAGITNQRLRASALCSMNVCAAAFVESHQGTKRKQRGIPPATMSQSSKIPYISVHRDGPAFWGSENRTFCCGG